MKNLKLTGAMLLVVGALAIAGFSLYRVFIYKPDDGLTPEQKAAAMKAVEAFSNKNAAPGK